MINDAPLLRRTRYAAGQRMRAKLLGRGGVAQESLCSTPRHNADFDHARPAFGERAGLSKMTVIDGRRGFDGLRVLEK